MARDDWRIRIELPEDEGGGLLDRLGLSLGSSARELAQELEGRRLAVSQDGNHVYVYASARREAEQARDVIEAELAELELEGRAGKVEHWLEAEERWDAEPAPPDHEEELLAEGYAPWEVRVECDSRDAAHELADTLEAEGYGVVRRYRYVIAGTASREDAVELAGRVHGEVEPGGELVWEVTPSNPFAVFLGGMGGAGTPL